MPVPLALDQMLVSVVQPPERIWSVFARSLGEQGAAGRTALAWRWALLGTCPSPVTLSPARSSPPDKGELLAEAEASAELGRDGRDAEGQVMQARFVLQWLAGEIDALPLWNGSTDNLHVTDGADLAHERAHVDEVYTWALLAQHRHPWCPESAPVADRSAFAWAAGAVELLAWVCGEAAEGPLSGQRTAGRPSLYEVSLDASRAMNGVLRAREKGEAVRVARREALMETFLWLAGWSPLPPVDRHGHVSLEVCPQRHAPCRCGEADGWGCLGEQCLACAQDICVQGFGQGGLLTVPVEAG